MSKVKRFSILFLVLLGLALSIELCVVYYNANFNVNAQPSICVISETMDCDSVAKTAYSQFLGVPLSLWGVLLYLFLLFMIFVDKLKNIKFLNFLGVFKNPLSYIFCISLFSFIVSMYLAYISFVKINSICVFCVITYFIDFIIALTAKNWKDGILFELKTSIKDFIDAIKIKRYAFWFLLIMLLGISVVSYTSVSNILVPQVIEQKKMQEYLSEDRGFIDGNTMGVKNGELVIHEFIDFNCGACFIANLYMHRIISEFENVRVEQHIIPFEKECNPYMPIEGHKGSCLKAKYAFAAALQNKYWQMSDILFMESPENEKEIIEKARLVDFDIKKLKEDLDSEQVKKELEDAVTEAQMHSITGTPTIFVGIKKVMGVGPYQQLQDVVISQGGRLKKEYEQK